ncbi:MAG TPA: hypothetical protein VIA10_13625 [Gaiellaceae bacterium]|jgi:hypothetical protein
MTPKRFLLAGLVVFALLPFAGYALANTNDDVEAARAATVGFHRLGAANAAGYGLFTDAAGIACIDNPSLGAMGVHYVNGALVGDAVLDVTRPEALVYEPGGLFTKQRLVALEYIVFKDVWEAAGHTAKPRLFGVDFDLTPSPNRYGIPAFYALHAWVWKDNPAGTFMPWNPRVHC